MGSPRTPGVGEEFATDIQPGGYHNATEVVQNTGAMVWDGSGWIPAAQALPNGNPKSHVGMAQVVPQIMNAAGELVPMLNSETLPDNSVGRNMAQVSIGLCNQNGNFDQQRNNCHGLVALKSEARTATAAASNIVNYNWNKLSFHLNITGNPGGGKSLTVSVFSASVVDAVVCRFPEVTASRLFQMAPGLEVGTPGNAEDALRENGVLPGVFTFQVIPSDSSSWTYELTYDLLL